MSPRRGREVLEGIRVLRIELGIANDRVAAAAGLHPRDLDVLDVIDRDAPCTPSHLAARTGIHPATLTGVLARLADAGWIHREIVPHDTRSCRLTPTDRFEELRHLYAGGDGGVRDLLSVRSPEAVREIATFLHQAAEVVRDAANALPTSQTPRAAGGSARTTRRGSGV